MNSNNPNNKLPKKLLFINPTADLYGVSGVLLEIISHLPRERYEPIVILPNEGPLKYELAKLNAACFIIPTTIIRRNAIKGSGAIKHLFLFLPNIIRLTRFIRRHHINLVHTNASVIVDGAFAARLSGLPHVWHIHEIIEDEFPKLWGLYQPVMTKLSVKVICVSKIVAKQFASISKIAVIPNGINFDHFNTKQDLSNCNNLLGKAKSEDIHIGVVGRISPRKGHEYLLNAYVRLITNTKDDTSHLFIIGDTFQGYEPFWQSLKAKVAALGLSDRVTFTGFIEGKANLYSLLDIVVVPSILPEGFGLVILEAMASHRPVIATAIGGPLEIIQPNISGILVPPNDSQALADALTNLIQNPSERERLGEGGYQRVTQVYDIIHTTAQIIKLYDEIMDQ